MAAFDTGAADDPAPASSDAFLTCEVLTPLWMGASRRGRGASAFGNVFASFDGSLFTSSGKASFLRAKGLVRFCIGTSFSLPRRYTAQLVYLDIIYYFNIYFSRWQ